MNPILSRIVEGRYLDGLAAYEALPEASPEDDRLAGVCLFNLDDFQRAKNVLLIARARGCEAAGIELATVYRHLGLVDLSHDALAGVDLDRLSTFDRVLALREWGAQFYTSGNVIGATDVLERAWALAPAAPLGSLVLPAIGHALGVAYADRGLDRRAVAYLTEALASANPARAVQLRAARALCLTNVGDFGPAEHDLAEAARDQGLVPVVAPYLTYVGAVLHAVRGRLGAADTLFTEASALARSAQEPETESFAELGRCAIATALGKAERASGFLERARSLAVNEKGHALVRLREGALMVQRGQPASTAVLEAAAASFGRLGLLREQAWAWLHTSASHLAFERHGDAVIALSRATDLRHALASGGSLVIELRMLPAVAALLAGLGEHAYAHALHHDLERATDAAPVPLQLRTLGAPELLVDGRRVRLDLRRSLEVLTYVLTHSDTNLEQVLLDLFPEADAAHGRSYFHQVRYELARAVSGLAIPFDPVTKTDRVRLTGLALEADVLAVERALTTGGEHGLAEALRLHRGPFLPNAESEWARTERDDLAASIVRLGRAVMRAWAEQGDHGRRRDLAARLLETDPFDEPSIEALVDATRASEGEAAANDVLDRLTRRLERELGTVSPTLVRLREGS